MIIDIIVKKSCIFLFEYFDKNMSIIFAYKLIMIFHYIRVQGEEKVDDR